MPATNDTMRNRYWLGCPLLGHGLVPYLER